MTENSHTKSSQTSGQLTDEAMRQLIVEAAQNKKAKGVSIIDLSAIETAPAREFIIVEGRTPQQVAAIADNIREELLDIARVKPYNYDGYRNAQWIVIDYGSVMVHVFTPDYRSLYNLEELWNDAVITEIADID